MFKNQLVNYRSRFVYRSTLFFSFSNLTSYLACSGNNSKATFRLENKSCVCSVLKRNEVYACLKYPSSAIFQQMFYFRKWFISVLGITYSIFHHQFLISGSVSGRAIFSSSAENYGQSIVKM